MNRIDDAIERLIYAVSVQVMNEFALNIPAELKYMQLRQLVLKKTDEYLDYFKSDEFKNILKEI